ncbi:leukotriene A-4 hydrolase-like protein [Pyrus ussuriensis x Pyrus communis]|uniref:Leukotriene A-4 hydrolase-like protein n=1 Tax=Pyrus ussuriensis x Pyrus communis TaxID=2448454 RepID=A0A5N5HP64_9ROSA|nr:leukotriene A-4 hydrolase-like protein [Pyrus ussuriensis x Pyrus communis]
MGWVRLGIANLITGTGPNPAHFKWADSGQLSILRATSRKNHPNPLSTMNANKYGEIGCSITNSSTTLSSVYHKVSPDISVEQSVARDRGLMMMVADGARKTRANQEERLRSDDGSGGERGKEIQGGEIEGGEIQRGES